ncbi:hypothetical protein CLV53_11556 [Sediminibacterium magnilacihabitans]|nr:hypothetical protein CLV53_11556 [Sediminibacterium magnilacihabitans]
MYSLSLAGGHIDQHNEADAQAIVYPLANKVASYFYAKYQRDIRRDFVNNPQGIIILGLLYAAKERHAATINMSASLHAPGQGLAVESNRATFDCLLSVVGSVIGLSDARNLWQSIAAGATEETAIAALKVIGRRVAGVITVAIMVYDLGSCLDWW